MISPHLDRLADALTELRYAGPLYARQLPLTVRNESNLRSRWATRERAAEQRQVVGMALGNAMREFGLRRENVRLAVRLLRLYSGRGQAMDDDGLARAFKAVRDGVADALAIDDRNPRVVWVPDQQRSDVTAVRIEFYRLKETP